MPPKRSNFAIVLYPRGRKALSDFSAQIPNICSYPPTTIDQSLNGNLNPTVESPFSASPHLASLHFYKPLFALISPKTPYMLKKRNLLVLIGQLSYQLLLDLFCPSMFRSFLGVSREGYSAQLIPQQRLVKL